MMEAINLEHNISVLKLHKIFSSNIQFNTHEVLVEAPATDGDNKLQFTFNFSVRSEKPYYIVVVGVHLTSEKNPFDLKMDITGIFTIESDLNESNSEYIDDLLAQNAVAIMFPFLRTYISSVSHMGGISGINVPVFNIAAAFSKARDKKKM